MFCRLREMLYQVNVRAVVCGEEVTPVHVRRKCDAATFLQRLCIETCQIRTCLTKVYRHAPVGGSKDSIP